MANIIAVVWDYDKTLIDGYMQDPIFKKYGVDGQTFWDEVNELPGKYLREQGVRVNRDSIYLNHFINRAQDGTFAGLNNAMLREFGKEQVFYSGVPEIFSTTKEIVANNKRFREYDVRVEHYIVSAGMKEVIEGSAVRPFVEGVWGCELIEREINGVPTIAEIGYLLDNTSKTRALFEINKGVPQHPEIDVNAKMPDDARRVRFEDMIYIADGPSDVPAFSLVKKNGGATLAVFPKRNVQAFRQAERMRADGRVDMCAEADYTSGSVAQMWIANKIEELAERFCSRAQGRLLASVSAAPRNL